MLNGRAHTRNWIAFHNITDGGTLHFVLGATPEKHWGARAEDAPPSLSDTPAAPFGTTSDREQSHN
jgi:putative alpha-1,2-mannosidase